MLPTQKSSTLGFVLFFTTIATAKPLTSIVVPPVLAQTAPTVFPLPTSVPTGTTVRVDGSSSTAAVNQALKQRFESQFSGSTINLNYSGTPAALQELSEGKIDLASIGRPLTQAERDRGLIPVPLERGKIAIIVSPENSFKGSITVPQFVRIVRGEITDWSELGGEPGKIRFVDRPELSDTRAAFRNYSVFIQSPYELGNTAALTGEDSTQSVAQQLGKDGLSYAPANQVLNQPSVRIVPMHNTLPTDPRYPFSQPFYYVHTANPAPGTAAFLGYATSEAGQQIARSTETDPGSLGLNPAVLLAAGSAATAALNSGTGTAASPNPTASPIAPTSTPSPIAQASPTTETTGTAAGTTAEPQPVGAVPPGSEPNDSGIPGWLWWLLPLGLGALLLGWLWRSRRPTPTVAETPTPPPPPTPATTPPPPPLMTPVETDGSLASRAGSVISSDRAEIAEVSSPSISPGVALGGAALAGAGAAAAIGSGRSTTPELGSETETIGSGTGTIGSETETIDSGTETIGSETETIGSGTETIGSGTGTIGSGTETIDSGTETIGSETETIDSGTETIGSETETIDSGTETIGSGTETIEVLDRPLVEIREMPPIETPTSMLEPPAAPPATGDPFPSGAILGGVAGLGAAGAAAWMNRPRSDDSSQTDSPDTEPLTSLDTIEPLDEAEVAAFDPATIENNLDTLATIDENAPIFLIDSEPLDEVEDAALDQPPIDLEFDDSLNATNEIVPPSTNDVTPLMSFDAIEPLNEAEAFSLEQSTIDPNSDEVATFINETPEFLATDEYVQMNLDDEDFDPKTAGIEDADLTIADSIPTESMTESIEDPTVIQGTIPGLAALGGAAVVGAIGLSQFDDSSDVDPSPIAPSSHPDLEFTSPQVEFSEIDAGTDLETVEFADEFVTIDAAQIEVEAARFEPEPIDLSSAALASVDEGLAPLPEGYGESRIVLMPRDPQWAYAYWDIPNEHKTELRNQGGQSLVLRLYDVTDIDALHQSPHSMQQFGCDEMARDWYLPIPVSDRDYYTEIGYLTAEEGWLMLARSLPVRVPPAYPSAWEDEQFVTVAWETELRDQTAYALTSPLADKPMIAAPNGMYDQIFDLSQGVEVQRIAGSIFGSMQQLPIEAIRSFVSPSGMGMWALPTASGIGMSGIWMSGIGMSGIGMSGIGMIPNQAVRSRRFWLVADAELIIHGATEPDATVSIAGETIALSPDGTFRFQMSFQDGLIDTPILAVAKDGEQTRSIHLKFTRETPHRNTNPKEDASTAWSEARDEWQA